MMAGLSFSEFSPLLLSEINFVEAGFFAGLANEISSVSSRRARKKSLLQMLD